MRMMTLAALTAVPLVAGGGIAAAQQDQSVHPTNINASITLEQKQRIRAVVLGESTVPPLARVDFSLTIGNVVSRSVAVAPVPDSLVEAFPGWRDYAYFVLHDQIQIIIVNPRDQTIVAIIA